MSTYRSPLGWGTVVRWLTAAILYAGIALMPQVAHADPVITGLSAAEGPIASNITIYGTGFGNSQGSGYVTFNGEVVPVISWADVAIYVLIQPTDVAALSVGSSYPVQVVVQPNAVHSNTLDFGLTTLTPVPTPPPTPLPEPTPTPAPTPAPTPSPTTTPPTETQLLTDALLVERLAAQLYNLNADKPYLTAATPVTNPGGTTPPEGVTGAAEGTPASSLGALKGMVDEIRAHHSTHVSLLEQALGTNAPPVPAFQNLDAPTLTQFLTLAQSLEDFASGAHQGILAGAITTGVTATPGSSGTSETNPSFLPTLLGIALDDARHAGALRGYRKTASTADGGDPSTVISDEGAVTVPRTHDQITAFVQPYLAAEATTPGTTTPATGNTGTGTTTPSP